MSLLSIVLTSFAGAYYFDGVSHGGGPIETLLEYVSDKGAWHYMVTINAPMDIL
jgi:hypothetical protein